MAAAPLDVGCSLGCCSLATGAVCSQTECVACAAVAATAAQVVKSTAATASLAYSTQARQSHTGATLQTLAASARACGIRCGAQVNVKPRHV
jgi:hypothetical protein